jgi:hypothetical protein
MAFVLRCRHNFADAKKVLQRGKLSQQGALQACASLQSHTTQDLAPAYEYEACLSYAQSTIIF